MTDLLHWLGEFKQQDDIGMNLEIRGFLQGATSIFILKQGICSGQSDADVDFFPNTLVTLLITTPIMNATFSIPSTRVGMTSLWPQNYWALTPTSMLRR
jgi:hypothetical protein